MSSFSKKPWHILGAGAIGSLWANYLLRAGQPVTLLCRSAAALDVFGATPTLTLVLNDHHYQYQPHTELISTSKPIKKILVATKSYDTETAFSHIRHRINNETIIVILQNGMGAQQQIANDFPNNAVYAGTTTEGAYRPSPQQVVHAGNGETWLGALNNPARSLGSEPLGELLSLELTSQYEPNITARLWQKLAINCAINGLTAIHNCHNRELSRNPDYQQQMRCLCTEVEQVAAALKMPLFQTSVYEVAQQVAEATAENISSMLQDVRHHRRTEIDFLNGYLCCKATELGIKVPHNQQLLEQVKQLRY